MDGCEWIDNGGSVGCESPENAGEPWPQIGGFTSVEVGGRRAVDFINHPPHYTFGKIEVIDVIEDWGLSFHLAQVVKYVARSKHKGSELEDLKKARYYLNRLITSLEK